jgi:5'-deoxynucleotidase YfbR-like HD superfamily hydrolase
VPEEAFIGLTIKLEPEESTRTQKQIIRSNQDALAAFVSKKAAIDAMLTCLQALSDDHFGYSPDEITWSHIGTLEHYAELLKRITDMAFNEGDHAE